MVADDPAGNASGGSMSIFAGRRGAWLPFGSTGENLEQSAQQKTLSQKLAKGYTGVKKPFTLVRTAFNVSFPGARRGSLQQPLNEGGPYMDHPMMINQDVDGHDDQRRPYGR